MGAWAARVSFLWRVNIILVTGVVPDLIPRSRNSSHCRREHASTGRYFFRRVSRNSKDTAAKMTPAPLSAPARIALCDMPRSSWTISPNSSAVAAAPVRPRIWSTNRFMHFCRQHVSSTRVDHSVTRFTTAICALARECSPSVALYGGAPGAAYQLDYCGGATTPFHP
jgi:hypothetical protein